MVEQTVSRLPDDDRVTEAIVLARKLIELLAEGREDLLNDRPVAGDNVLRAVSRLRPDGRAEQIEKTAQPRLTFLAQQRQWSMGYESSRPLLPSRKHNHWRNRLFLPFFVALVASGSLLVLPASQASAGSRQATPSCGDGVVDEGETCDDGGNVGGDGCSATCGSEVLTCDHGICEQGAALGGLCGICENEICRADSFCCQVSWDDVCVAQVETVCGDDQCVECGNGATESGEECDDGNKVSKDGCSQRCVLEFCGDSIVNNGNEQCDDGNTLSGDGCNASCQSEASDCSHSQCSQGAPLRPDCTSCTQRICDIDPRCCSKTWDALCIEAVGSICELNDCVACGNGAVEIDEECDDGNLQDGDGCSSVCENEPPPAEVCQTLFSFGFEDVEQLDDAVGNLFPFQLDFPATVTFRTIGSRGCPGDTVIDLFDSLESGPFASNDDGGIGTCSALRVSLNAGSYSIFVRPFESTDDFAYMLEIYEEESCAQPTSSTTTTLLTPSSTTSTTTLPPTTTTTLVPSDCGNGQVNTEEDCDDGNSVSGDGCSSSCVIESLTCSHDVCVEGLALGGNCGACQLAVCQDDSFCCTELWDDTCVGIADDLCEDTTCCSHSVCEEGDALDAACSDCATLVCDEDDYCCDEEWDSTCVELAEDLCESRCRFCGNGITEGDEECDDGNSIDGDGCSDACIDECGNGSLEGDEECDDGGRENGDGCSESCRDECGSDVLSDGEECDDGNRESGDGCSVFCEIESQTCEHSECSLGSALAGSCSACSLAVCQDSERCCTSQWDEYCLSRVEEHCDDLCKGCGNGVRAFDGSEECDDFNNEDGDGCSSTCTLEEGQLFDVCTTRYVSGFRQFGSPTGTLGGFLRIPFELASPTFVQFRAETVRTGCTGPAKISILQGDDQVVVANFTQFGTCPEINQLLPAGSYVFEYSNTQPVFFFVSYYNPTCPAPTTTTTSTSTTTSSSTSTSTTTTLPPAVCGNGVVEGDEDCDDGEPNGQTEIPRNGDANGFYCTTACVARDCGTPATSTSPPLTTDALWALRAAVRLVFCDLRLCDVNNDGQIKTNDALDLLRKSVSLPVELHCPTSLAPD